MATLNIVGGGLAGCEAAFQAAKRGAKVRLYDMKPEKFTPAHKSAGLCELVCSNSLKSDEVTSSGGLLKAEMRLAGSLILDIAEKCRVPAGGALAVDRDRFSGEVTAYLSGCPDIEIVRKEITGLDFEGVTIIATGPLTHGKLYESIGKAAGGYLSFFDASAPIVTSESLDRNRCFEGARYGKGSDYINCPMDKEEYIAFLSALTAAETVIKKDFEKNIFEGCMPVEIMAARGADTLRFGPLKPVGFTDPYSGRRPYALVQLRAESGDKRLYNLVGFQTNLKFGEQKRVFSMIPALKNAEFTRYGVMHRNSFVNAPACLDGFSRLKTRPDTFIAGQLSGVEGYMESAFSGMLAGINACRIISGLEPVMPPRETMSGALMNAVLNGNPASFQPVPVSFGLLPEPEDRIKDKEKRKEFYAQRALAAMQKFHLDLNI